MEDVCKADGKKSTTSEFPTTETSGSILHILSTPGRTSKLSQHLHILHTPHINSNSTSEEGTYFQLHATFQQMYQGKPPALLRRCTKLDDWNINN